MWVGIVYVNLHIFTSLCRFKRLRQERLKQPLPPAPDAFSGVPGGLGLPRLQGFDHCQDFPVLAI
jgi:hypothetical protein